MLHGLLLLLPLPLLLLLLLLLLCLSPSSCFCLTFCLTCPMSNTACMLAGLLLLLLLSINCSQLLVPHLSTSEVSGCPWRAVRATAQSSGSVNTPTAPSGRNSESCAGMPCDT
jgi:hypothetical protein